MSYKPGDLLSPDESVIWRVNNPGKKLALCVGQGAIALGRCWYENGKFCWSSSLSPHQIDPVPGCEHFSYKILPDTEVAS